MSANYPSIGSIWRRWDLHLHAPGTKLSNGFGEVNDTSLERYVMTLEASAVKVFGITDYFSFDSYKAVLDAYQRKFPEGKKLFIPNIEFRLTETISHDARHVHTHVLIDPALATPAKFNTLLNDLQTHITRNDVRVRCSELSSKADYEQATVSITEIQKALAAVFPDHTSYLIVTAANNDGLKSVDTRSPRSMSISDELDKASDAFFGSSKNTQYFLQRDRYEDGTMSERKPVFSGSDAHSFSDLDRLTGDEIGFEATWIKADLTFRGLRQTLFEPEGRVHLGDIPAVMQWIRQEATRFIAELRVDHVTGYSGGNGLWFKDVAIPFNPELTAIIGHKGSGKSAVADIISLLGESRQFEHFSFLTNKAQNRKFRQKGYAENFTGVLLWRSQAKSKKRLHQEVDLTIPEAVKYLPQNYFESLTNEIEVDAFLKKIEEVVFSHVEESDRMGKSSFSDLGDLKTAQSKANINILKVRLHELNMELVGLEKMAKPEEKNALLEQLRKRQHEYGILESQKPEKVQKPEGLSDEQKQISSQIGRMWQNWMDVDSRKKQVAELLSKLKVDFVRLGNIKEEVSRIDLQINESKERLRADCVGFDLNVDTIVTHHVNTATIDEKIQEILTNIRNLEHDSGQVITDAADFSSFASVPELRRAAEYLTSRLKVLQEALSAPQRRYQRYIQAETDLSSRMMNIMGHEENPKFGTINDILIRIRYIETHLNSYLEQQYGKRDQIAHSIFEAKKMVRAFYEGLKSSVEKRLEAVRTGEFDVTIDASFVPSHEFPNQFFDLVNQTAVGPFRGTAQGATVLEQKILETNWNDFDSVLKFAKSIIKDIHEEDVGKQIKDIERFYDLLFSFEYFDSRYELRLSGKNLNQLSPGEKGMLLLIFYLHLDKEKIPLIIDQPEDNLDNDSIYSVLATCIREAKKTRQVILVTHNPNLAVGADAEQIIHVSLDKSSNYKFSYESGSIENPRINDVIVKILEGSKPAFVQRRLKYQIK